MLLPAFDFDEFLDDISTVLNISIDGFPLRFHAEAGDALFVGGDAEIGTSTTGFADRVCGAIERRVCEEYNGTEIQCRVEDRKLGCIVPPSKRARDPAWQNIY